MKMPAPPDEAARDIARIGADGRPGDAKSGPGLLRLEMLGLIALVLLVSGGVGLWAGWRIGVVMVVVGILALLFNPVLMATIVRAGERKQAAKEENDRSDRSSRSGR